MHGPSRRRATAIQTVAALAVGLAGCSLVLPLDGLTGADAGTGAETSVVADDASSPGEDAPAADARNDASRPVEGGAPDGGGGRDAELDASEERGVDAAPRDAGPGTDAVTVGYCASLSPKPLFCDDFDEVSGNPGWDQVTGNAGTVVVTGGESVSSPDSMLCSINANAGSGSIDLAGYKSLTSKQGASGTATLSFEMRIDTGDTSSASDAVLGAIQLWNGSALYAIELELKYASATTWGVSMTESTGTAHAAPGTITRGNWAHVTLSVALPAGSGGATTASLGIDGTSMLSTTVHVLSAGATIPSPIPEAIVGSTFATPASTGWSIRYDNVTYDVR